MIFYFNSPRFRIAWIALVALSSGLFVGCNRKFNYATIKAPQSLSKCGTDAHLTDPRKSGQQVCSPANNIPSGKSLRPPRTGGVIPSVADGVPKGFVSLELAIDDSPLSLAGQSSSFKSWFLGLTAGGKYSIEVRKLTDTGYETIYSTESATLAIPADVRADGYLIVSVMSPDGTTFEGVLVPAFGDKDAVLTFDRTSTAAAGILRRIQQKRLEGELGAAQSITKYLISVEHLYTLAYASLLVLDEKQQRALSTETPSADDVGHGIVAKTEDALASSRMNPTQYSFVISESAYANFYKARTKLPTVIPAFKNPQVADLDVGLKVANNDELLNKAYEISANLLRPSTADGALIAVNRIPGLFHDAFSRCLAGNCEPQGDVSAQASTGVVSYFKNETSDLLGAGSSNPPSDGGAASANIVNNGVLLSASSVSNTITTATFAGGANLQVPGEKTVALSACDFTVDTWVNLRVAPKTLKVSMLIDNTSTVSTLAGTFKFFINPDLSLSFERNLLAGGTWKTTSNPAVIALKSWQQVTLMRDGSAIKFLVNGVAVHSEDMPVAVEEEPLSKTSLPWTIGASPSDPLNSGYNGDMEGLQARACPVKTLAKPIFSPSEGGFGALVDGVQLIGPKDADIYYTTDGTAPTSQSAKFDSLNPNASVSVPRTLTINAVAMRKGWLDSPVATANYKINGRIGAPMAIPPPGFYAAQTAVSLVSAVDGAVIEYSITKPGDLPQDWQNYSKPIDVASEQTIHVRSSHPQYISPSVTVSYEYEVPGVVGRPSFNPPNGPISNVTNVKIKSETPKSTIYYTTDGSVPSLSSQFIPSGGTVSFAPGMPSIRAIAVRPRWQSSPEAQLTGTVAEPVASIPTGYHEAGPLMVRFTTPTLGAVVHYSFDQIEWHEADGEISIASNQTIYAKASKAGYDDSRAVLFDYYFPTVSPKPVFEDDGKSPRNDTKVTVKATYKDTSFDVYCTTDGSIPVVDPTYLCNDGVTIAGSSTLKAISAKGLWQTSEVASKNFQMQVSDIKFQLDGQYINQGQELNNSKILRVVLDSAGEPTRGALVYYTVDGSSPTKDSLLYTNGIQISRDSVVRAIAIKDNYAPSPEITTNFSMKIADLAFYTNDSKNNQENVELSNVATVTIRPRDSWKSVSSGMKIYYTNDGSAPSISSTLYQGGIQVGANATLRAIAVLENYQSPPEIRVNYKFKNADPVFVGPSTFVNTPADVSITCSTNDAVIRYTMDGQDPDGNSAIYTGPIRLNGAITNLAAVAMRDNFAASAVVRKTFKLQAAEPSFDPEPVVDVSFPDVLSVKVTSGTSNARIYYTTDGTAPSVNSAIYNSPIKLAASGKLRAIAVRDDLEVSTSHDRDYVLAAVPPKMDPKGNDLNNPKDFYDAPKQIRLSSDTPGATIYYRLDGKDPVPGKDPVYSSPIVVVDNTQIKAVAVKEGFNPSSVSKSDYRLLITTCTEPVYACFVGEWICGAVATSNSVKKSVCDNIGFEFDGQDVTSGRCGVAQCASSCQEYYSRTSVKDVSVTPMLLEDECPSTLVSQASQVQSAAACADLQASNPDFMINWDVFIGSSCTTMSGGQKISTPGIVSRAVPNFTPIAAPSPSVASGVYTTAQTVTLDPASISTTALSNKAVSSKKASIYYTTDGSPPTSKSKLYTAPITVASTTTIKAIAIVVGAASPQTMTATYTITGTVPMPTFSVLQGAYASAQSVTIIKAAPNDVVYYTVDGSLPTRSSPVYASPLTISNRTTLKAIAVRAGWADSPVTTAEYFINGRVATPLVSVLPGAYGASQSVILSTSTSGAVIYYTLDGSTPSLTSAVYAEPINIASSKTINAFAVRSNYLDSELLTAPYTINGTVAAPTAVPPASVYPSARTVDLSTETPGAIIYYTVDGSSPLPTSPVYTGPIFVGASQVIRAIAVKDKFVDSAPTSFSYTITGSVASPAFDPPEGAYGPSQNVSLSSATPGAVIYYTTDGSAPTVSSSRYVGPIAVNHLTVIKAMAALDSWSPSGVVSAQYSINGRVDPPVISVPSGTYGPAQIVTITSSTSGSVIHYTQDGSEPSVASPVYTAPLNIFESKTLKAIATKSGYSNSYVASALYTINGPAGNPSASVPSGLYTSAQNVTLTSSTSGASIYYTLDGSPPTAASTKYTGAFMISESATLKAFANTPVHSDSAIIEYTYTITGTVQTPQFSVSGGAYAGTQTLTLTTSPQDAKIYFTVNGTEPSRQSTLYTGPLTVSTSQTVSAFAVKTDWADSPPVSAIYVINGQVTAPTLSVASGSYGPAQTVSIGTETPGATIFYTVDGTTPTIDSNIYTSPISVTATQKIKAFAVKAVYLDSPEVVGDYVINGPSAKPTATPNGGNFYTAQSVTLETATVGANIYYTTDGSTPTTDSSLYTGPVFVGVSQTLKAVSAKTAFLNSEVLSADFNIYGTVQNPDFSVPQGEYGSAQMVGLSSATPGATIYYTMDGSEPSSSSAVYAGPIAVSSLSSATTIKAYAVKTNWQDSAVSTAVYTINGAVDRPRFSIPGGGYGPTQSVSLTSPTPGAEIYYTLDGVDPTASSARYSVPITVSSSTTLKAFATKQYYADSAVSTAVYTINGAAEPATASLADGTYYGTQSIMLFTPTSGGDLYYTLDGSTPTTNSNYYWSPIVLNGPATLKIITAKAGFSDSEVSTYNYTIYGPLPAPTFSLASGGYGPAQTVAIDSATAGSVIHYTVDGSTPTAASAVYTTPVTVSSSLTLKAIASKSPYPDSAVAVVSYTINGSAAQPVASPAAGSFNTAQAVSLSSSTDGAAIFYTLDGSVPTTSSSRYNSAIFVGVSQTIKAIAVKSGYINSAPMSAEYRINGNVQTPIFSVVSGTYGPSQSVTIYSATPGATIYYTTNGANPTTASSIYSGAVQVSSSMTLKAFAVLAEWADSAVASESYVINGPVAAPIFSVPGGGYADTQTVSISTMTAGAVIRYTIDGTNPWASSPVYTTPISVPATATIKAYATKDNFVDSSIATASYVISTGSMITVNFSNNQTVIQPKTGGTVTTTALNSMSGIVAAIGANPIARLTLTGTGSFTWDAVPSGGITDVVVNSGATLTAAGFSSGDGQAASLGNGHLIFAILGSLTVNSGGKISMDSLGYFANRSYDGVNLGGAGRNGSGCNSAGAGGYATIGASGVAAGGSAFGSSDFWTKLYLGSGGGSATVCSYDSYTVSGGRGGGAIAISAVNIYNSGTISAKGQDVSSYGGAGSGGTVYLNASGTLSNTGTISAAGGGGAIKGGSGRIKFNFASLGSLTGSVVGLMPSDVVQFTGVTSSLNGTSSIVQNTNGLAATAYSVPLNSMSAIKTIIGAQNPPLTFTGTGSFTFDSAYDFALNDLSLANGQTVTINSSVTNIRDVTVNAGGVLNINSDIGTIRNLSVYGTVYGPAYSSSTGDGKAATFGNGHLILNVSSAANVYSGGKINMDARGYTGNRSYTGLNLGGAGRTSGCSGTSGSYGSPGYGGSGVFGENDFASNLYLGSGGGDAIGCWGYDGSYNVGGSSGGGAIFITARDFSNAGTISATGGNGTNSSAGFGSGGTIYLRSYSTFSNSGTITTDGGFYSYNSTIRGGSGRVKISYGTLASSTGSIKGMVATEDSVLSSVSISLNAVSTFYQNAYGTAALGYASQVNTMSALGSTIGSKTPDLNFSGTGTFTFDVPFNKAKWDLSVGGNQSVVVNAGLGTLRNVDIASGGTLTFNSDPGTFTNLKVAGTLTGAAYSAGTGQSPTFGNGRLLINLSGGLTVTSTGKITMDGKGYSANRSYAGLNLGGAGRTSGCSGGGGSYATAGSGGASAGSVFGADDFSTNLYLGSGGGNAVCSGYDGDYTVAGGAGGGAISIAAAVIENAGAITALGGSKGNYDVSGAGSGGTIYLVGTKSFISSGTISVQGGTGKVPGGQGRLKFGFDSAPAVTGTIVGVKAADPADAPIFSQPAGTYGPSVAVALFSATAGASFYYTVDGSTPTTSSTAYNSPIVLTASATIKAISTKSGLTNSIVSVASYVIDGPLAVPVASPAAGTYASAQAVSLSTTSNGAKIYYTLDGSTPTASSTLYSGQIFVAVDQVIKAISVKPNYVNSAALSASYTLTGTVRPPAFSLAAGEYGPAQMVALTSDTPGATIYYTTDGSVPSRSSSVYSAPIAVNSSKKISAFAVLASWNDSMMTAAAYTINGTVPTPTFNIPSGTYPGQQSIAILSSLTGASIYYTVDGSTPTTSSLLYTSPVVVSASSTIKTFASKANYVDSGIASATYTISDGVSVTINLTSNQTVVTPTSGSATTSAAVATMSALNALVGANPISTLTLSGTGTFTWDAAPTNGVNNLTINSGVVLTGQPMTSGDGLSPTLGNGHLIIDIRGLLTVNAGGTISMDGRGYGYGLTAAPKQGASTSGAGAGVFNSANGGGGCAIQFNTGSGASYGTYGSGVCRGNLYGATDYWTKLYLGSQGGSGYECGYDCNYTVGGAGGGAIKISAGSINSSGKISANGAAGGGGGSGGTIYLYTAGTFQHQAAGSITVDGGGSGGKGRIRIEAARTLVADGTISPAPALGPWLSSIAGQNNVSSMILDPAGSSVVINGTTYKIGSLVVQDGLDPLLDAISTIKVDTIVVQGGAKVTATSPLIAYPLNISLNNGSLTLPITPDLSPGNVTLANNSVLVTTGTGSFKNVKISSNSSLTTSATQFGDLSVYGAGSTLTVNASATFGAVVADSGATLNLNGSMSFASLNIGQYGTTTVTAAGYQSAGTTTSWATAPAAGNGQLIFDVVGALTVGEFATVTMDGKGYGFGLTSAPKQGASPVGIGASALGASNGGGGAAIQFNVGGGGSYGTSGTRAGAGSVYGASDYWTKLYLGSQGGSGYECGYDCNYTAGGAGGGAVKITAGTIDNSGKITSNGASGGGGGSGGTVYIYTRNSLSHRSSGSILANGGSYGGKGRIRIEGAVVAASDGAISPAPSMATFIRSIASSANITALTLDATRSIAVFNGNTFVMGSVEKTSSANESLDTLTGINIGTLTIQNGVAMSGGSSFNNLVISSGASLTTSAKTFGNLTVTGASSSVIINGSATIGAATVDYGGALKLAGSNVFASLSVGQNGTSTVMANGFEGSGSASGWTTMPSPGNGQLMLFVSGTIDNGPFGVISMDAKGYGYNSSSAGRQGASPSGTGTVIYGMPNGGGGGSGLNVAGSGASYGTVGGGSYPGNVYGATDFWINLYLGSQGGGGYFNGYDSYYTSGGAGGGAIYVSANSIVNSGRISVDGGGADTGGSGGTIVLNSVNFTNNSTGTLYARGGSGTASGGAGRIGINYTGNYSNTGTITPAALAVPASVPGIPTGLSATAGDQQVVLTWVAPVDSARVSPTDYQIQYSLAGGSWVTYSDGVSSATSATMTGLQNSKYYKFRVAAISSGQNGPYSTNSADVVPRAPTSVTGVLDGSTASQAAPSAAYIKSILPNSPDGVYWIDLPLSGPQQVYCLMNSSADGGGWMLAMKATRGTTFSYDSAYWTQYNTLNTSSLDRTDADAKFSVMNEFAAKDVMALWPDLGAGGDIGGLYSSWVWLEKNILGGLDLTTFFGTTGQMQLGRTRGSQWAGKFSSQSGFQFYGFNYQTGFGYQGVNVKVRWGFGWNNETDQNTNDVTGGIGMGKNSWSAGDSISCCNDTTGINRSARVEIYVK